MAQYGIQWDTNALSGTGQIQWLECKPPNKYLLKQDSKFYTIKSTNYDLTTHNFIPLTLVGGLTPTIEDYINFGFEDFSLLTQNMTVGTETFRPIDKFYKSKPLEIYKCIEK